MQDAGGVTVGHEALDAAAGDAPPGLVQVDAGGGGLFALGVQPGAGKQAVAGIVLLTRAAEPLVRGD